MGQKQKEESPHDPFRSRLARRANAVPSKGGWLAFSMGKTEMLRQELDAGTKPVVNWHRVRLLVLGGGHVCSRSVT